MENSMANLTQAPFFNNKKGVQPIPHGDTSYVNGNGSTRERQEGPWGRRSILNGTNKLMNRNKQLAAMRCNNTNMPAITMITLVQQVTKQS
jgi:hypothetical protein